MKKENKLLLEEMDLLATKMVKNKDAICFMKRWIQEGGNKYGGHA